MPDYAGPLQRLVFSRTLWLIVAWPVVGLVWQVAVARRRIARAAGDSARRRELAAARNAGVACLGLAAVATLAHAAVLARTPEGARALFEHVASAARIGCLDAAIDLWFDPLSATFCSLACLVALAASAVVATTPDANTGASWRTWAWLQLSLAGTLVALLADGFVGIAMGWTLAGGAATWLAGWPDRPAAPDAGGARASGRPPPPLARGARRDAADAAVTQAMRCAVAACLLLVGAALLFWGLGGSWDGEDYLPDFQPRFMPVRAAAPAEQPPATSTTASLTLTSAPGAAVFLDDSRTPLAVAPFMAASVASGTHTVRVRPADASVDEVVGRIAFAAGDDVALVPFGPTLAFRAIGDQLAVGEAAARRDMEVRAGPGGTAVVAASLVAILLSAWAMSGASPPTSAPRTLGAVTCAATTAMLGPYLLARLAFLFPLAPHTWAAVESIGAASLLAAGWYAPVLHGVRRWLAFLGVAPAALTWLALGAAGVAAATYVAIVAGLATAAFYLGAAITPTKAAREPLVRGVVGDWLLARMPERLGALFVGMDRWVIGAMAGAVASLVHAGAWTVAALDERVIASSGNRIAARIVRAQHRVEPVVGGRVDRVAWAFVTAVALAAITCGLWPSR